jgi:PAS domain S-box-containing protein
MGTPAPRTGRSEPESPGHEPDAPLDSAHVAALVEMAADAIIATSPEERITFWNRGAEDMFGYTAPETVGRPFDFLLPDEERTRGELEWIHRTTLEHGAIRSHETRRRRKDGTVIDVSLTRTAVYDRERHLVGFTAILRDISDRRRLERNLLTSQRLAAAGQVAAAVAHQIGAPLTALSMTIEHMRNTRCADCAGTDQMGVLQSQTDRIARLTRQLVELAKPVGVKRTQVVVGDVIAMAVGMLQSQFAQKGVQVTIALDPDLPPLKADGAQLQQALLNVLLNAHRAVAPSTGEVRIGARRQGQGAVAIIVRDNGDGIAAQDLPHIFTPFFSKAGGAGLGLAIAAQVVQAHGGSIDAESHPGSGTTCTITLPWERSDD